MIFIHNSDFFRNKKMHLKKLSLIYIVFAMLFITGCVGTSPMASTSSDHKAKQFIANKNKSNIYIYRKEVSPFTSAVPVFVDSTLVGKTLANTYIKITVKPGTHDILSFEKTPKSVRLNTKPSRNYYIQQNSSATFRSYRTSLQIVSSNKAKKAIQKCKLIQHVQL